MAVDILDKTAQFATSGFIASRMNPDGTAVSAQRVLGFNGTIDLTMTRNGIALLDANNTAKMAVKIDGGAWQVKELDFSSAADLTKVTTTEFAAAVTAAAFTGITATVLTQAEGGRIKLSATGTDAKFLP